MSLYLVNYEGDEEFVEAENMMAALGAWHQQMATIAEIASFTEDPDSIAQVSERPVLHRDCGPLCPLHGDPRDTSVAEVAS